MDSPASAWGNSRRSRHIWLPSRAAVGVLLLLTLGALEPAQAWFDGSHRAIMIAAGAPAEAHNASGPDMMTSKVPQEGHNHFSNAILDDHPAHARQQIRDQATRYDQNNPEGHLLGAVLAALRTLQARQWRGGCAAYERGFLAHYVGDLLQPLHTGAYDAFNRREHLRIDGLMETVPKLATAVAAQMTPMNLRCEDEVVAAIAEAAHLAARMNVALRASGTLSQEQGLILLAHAASLLRALYAYAGANAACGAG